MIKLFYDDLSSVQLLKLLYSDNFENIIYLSILMNMLHDKIGVDFLNGLFQFTKYSNLINPQLSLRLLEIGQHELDIMILSWITSGIINDFFKSFYWGKSKHR
jgi:hypothetical protein